MAARLTITGTPVRGWLGRAPDGTSFAVTEYGMYELRGDRFTHPRNLVDVEQVTGPPFARWAADRRDARRVNYVILA